MKLDDETLCGVFDLSDISALKKRIRRDCLYLRSSLSAHERAEADLLINHILVSHFDPASYSCVCAYVSDGTEVDVTPLMKRCLELGVPLALPRFKSRGEYEFVLSGDLSFVSGRYCIPEPPESAERAPESLLRDALFIVPGVAFDSERHRLGRGAGVYDRVLAGYGRCSAGVFYECQKCRALPVEEHDRSLDAVVTERTFLRGSK